MMLLVRFSAQCSLPREGHYRKALTYAEQCKLGASCPAVGLARALAGCAQVPDMVKLLLKLHVHDTRLRGARVLQA